MNVIYRGLLTLEACSWMLVVFTIKENKPIGCIPAWLFALIIAATTVFLAFISLSLSKQLGNESDIDGCRACELADGSFLPVYLGYFFVSISVSNWSVMFVLFGIVFVFTHLSGLQIFNPLFLLFRYHYYHITTKNGTVIFVITRSKDLRNAETIHIANLHRINNMTYIERK